MPVSADKPVKHGFDHGPGGQDPIVGWGGGIDFNKSNTRDAAGNDADYLSIELTGAGPVSPDRTNAAFNLVNAASAGGITMVNDGTLGTFIEDNTDGGVLIRSTSATGNDPTETGTLAGIILKCESGRTTIDNDSKGIMISSSGNNGDGYGITLDFDGQDFQMKAAGSQVLAIKWNGSSYDYHIKSGKSWIADL